MRCRSCLAVLPDFLAEDLGAANAAAVRAHLQHCLPCRREAARWQQARKALLGAASGQANLSESWFAGLQQDIVARVAAELPEPATRRLPYRLARGLAAAVAVLLLGWCWLPAWAGAVPLEMPAAASADRATFPAVTSPAVGESWLARSSLALPTTMQLDADHAGGRWSEPAPHWPQMLLLGSESSGVGAGLQHRYRLRQLVATEPDEVAEPKLDGPGRSPLGR